VLHHSFFEEEEGEGRRTKGLLLLEDNKGLVMIISFNFAVVRIITIHRQQF
jgi:hypothetical protein